MLWQFARQNCVKHPKSGNRIASSLVSRMIRLVVDRVSIAVQSLADTPLTQWQQPQILRRRHEGHRLTVAAASGIGVGHLTPGPIRAPRCNRLRCCRGAPGRSVPVGVTATCPGVARRTAARREDEFLNFRRLFSAAADPGPEPRRKPRPEVRRSSVATGSGAPEPAPPTPASGAPGRCSPPRDPSPSEDLLVQRIGAW